MSASVADDLIRSYFDRWQRLEEEKRTVSDDLKELFAEAKGNGLDTKALRTVFREQVGDRAAIEEFDAVCDLYRASLSRPRAGRADAREKTLNNFVSPAVEPVQKTHEFDPETGEIIETQESSDGMASGSEHLSADHVSPPASQAAMGGGSANREQGDVDGSAARAGYGGQSLPLAGQIESRTEANFVDGTASLAAREGEQVAAPFPHSTVAAPAAAVEQPEAPNSSPATSGADFTRPAFPAVSGDKPGIPSSAADGAKTDGEDIRDPGRADLASDHRCVKAEQVANSAPVIGHVSFATSSHINPDDMPDIPAFLRRDFERAEA